MQVLDSIASRESARIRFPAFRCVPYIVLAVVAAVYLYPFLRVLTTTLDEGVFLSGAYAVTPERSRSATSWNPRARAPFTG